MGCAAGVGQSGILIRGKIRMAEPWEEVMGETRTERSTRNRRQYWEGVLLTQAEELLELGVTQEALLAVARLPYQHDYGHAEAVSLFSAVDVLHEQFVAGWAPPHSGDPVLDKQQKKDVVKQASNIAYRRNGVACAAARLRALSVPQEEVEAMLTDDLVPPEKQEDKSC